MGTWVIVGTSWQDIIVSGALDVGGVGAVIVVIVGRREWWCRGVTDRDVVGGGWGESTGSAESSRSVVRGGVEGGALMITAARVGVGDVTVDAGAGAEMRAECIILIEGRSESGSESRSESWLHFLHDHLVILLVQGPWKAGVGGDESLQGKSNLIEGVVNQAVGASRVQSTCRSSIDLIDFVIVLDASLV